MRTESPCIGVCRLDERGASCVGCKRTLSEIVSWSRLSDVEKSRVLTAVEERQAVQTWDRTTEQDQ